MFIVCELCGKPVREIPPKDNPKKVLGACDECHIHHMDLNYLDKQIREAGENPPDEK